MFKFLHEGVQSPLPIVDDKNGLVSTNQRKKEHLHDALNDQNYPIHMPTERIPPIQEASTCTDDLPLLQPRYAAERSRSQLKAYIGHKAKRSDICDCRDVYYFEDDHCPSCHRTYETSIRDINFSEHVAKCKEKFKGDPCWTLQGLDPSPPLRIRLHKALLALIEVSIPIEALQPAWSEGYRRSWGMKLHTVTSVEELLQVVEFALALQEAGCFFVVLECVLASVAAAATFALRIPTIGIGTRPFCIGQVN
ncbi:hypothetical protein LOK49_LG06G01946 [Camellia lanceoleosa]|uniref:Uncharacterized protein n=1 Tax=Camellia lanceoleosa TaxID=1840588 RepID=A0ACC0H9R5_9ERIC|nr:hypothetical protein LOK49_LG06G01946 [Camellia lanceoleosa]